MYIPSNLVYPSRECGGKVLVVVKWAIPLQAAGRGSIFSRTLPPVKNALPAGKQTKDLELLAHVKQNENL